MPENSPPSRDILKRTFAPLIAGPPAITLIPAFCLAAYWFGGEGALIVLAATLPIIYLATSGTQKKKTTTQQHPLRVVSADIFNRQVTEYFDHARQNGLQSAIFYVAIEDQETMVDLYGQSAVDAIQARLMDQITGVLRAHDSVGQMTSNQFAICLAPVHQLDLELCIQMAARLQTAIEEPISLDGTVVYAAGSIGFCQLSRTPRASAQDWMSAAEAAVREAQRQGPSAIRAYSKEMRCLGSAPRALRQDLIQALDLGQFHPWFQPQISTDTGKITGFEALARWSHPERGIISPAEFLPELERAGMLERLAEVMMHHSFAALNAWDSAGIAIPQVGVNFAGTELNNPRLVEKIEWELDRFNLTPDRLAVEVLETVVSRAPDDTITRNIKALGDLGCRIDLDDFGTGNASIASIRRFSVGRIKIDRSFVTKADRDPEQQRMIGAILTMAERLQIETLAEGVETVGEHVLLAQLGCDHVQGFGIARPMPFNQTIEWVTAHNAKLTDMPRLLDGKSS